MKKNCIKRDRRDRFQNLINKKKDKQSVYNTESLVDNSEIVTQALGSVLDAYHNQNSTKII